MRFFIPHAKDAEEAESVLESIAKFVQRPVPPSDKRVFKIAYTHNSRDFVAEVGKPMDSYYQEAGEVAAIFEGNPYLVCLPLRGVIRGDPILVGDKTVSAIKYFDPA
jgi:hypothetical protein